MQTLFFCSLIIIIFNNDTPFLLEVLGKLRTKVIDIWENFFPTLFLCIAVRIVSAFHG